MQVIFEKIILLSELGKGGGAERKAGRGQQRVRGEGELIIVVWGRSLEYLRFLKVRRGCFRVLSCFFCILFAFLFDFCCFGLFFLLGRVVWSVVGDCGRAFVLSCVASCLLLCFLTLFGRLGGLGRLGRLICLWLWLVIGGRR